ncbi:helix-turn-helix domain-containing protein [Acidobacteria bacterium AH-259-A15]|nr:helix-turn-helix domain-containing protein [Acidobacteria bacterium AH-259-A15]
MHGTFGFHEGMKCCYSSFQVEVNKNEDFNSWLLNKIQSDPRTQEKIAEEIGVRPNDLSRWKNGRAVPMFENFLKVAVYWREDPRNLFKKAQREDLVRLYAELFPKWKMKERPKQGHQMSKHQATLWEMLQFVLDHGHVLLDVSAIARNIVSFYKGLKGPRRREVDTEGWLNSFIGEIKTQRKKADAK